MSALTSSSATFTRHVSSSARRTISGVIGGVPCGKRITGGASEVAT
jgi:hypothetical protein